MTDYVKYFYTKIDRCANTAACRDLQERIDKAEEYGYIKGHEAIELTQALSFRHIKLQRYC